MTGRRRQDFAERLWSQVESTPLGCWIWSGCKNGYGYGQVWVGPGVRPMVHRVAYERLVGPIPDGLQLDHLCRNRACCNPAHLEPVTAAENKRRGNSIANLNAAKTHCPQGHPYDAGNTRRDGTKRVCRACRNARDRRRRQQIALLSSGREPTTRSDAPSGARAHP